MNAAARLAVALVAAITLAASAALAQEPESDSTLVSRAELLRALEGYGEHLTTLSTDMDKLKRIKFSAGADSDTGAMPD